MVRDRNIVLLEEIGDITETIGADNDCAECLCHKSLQVVIDALMITILICERKENATHSHLYF